MSDLCLPVVLLISYGQFPPPPSVMVRNQGEAMLSGDRIWRPERRYLDLSFTAERFSLSKYVETLTKNVSAEL